MKLSKLLENKISLDTIHYQGVLVSWRNVQCPVSLVNVVFKGKFGVGPQENWKKTCENQKFSISN